MKSILLKFKDEKFFYKLKKHKNKLEIMEQKPLSWERYFKILFSML